MHMYTITNAYKNNIIIKLIYEIVSQLIVNLFDFELIFEFATKRHTENERRLKDARIFSVEFLQIFLLLGCQCKTQYLTDL